MSFFFEELHARFLGGAGCPCGVAHTIATQTIHVGVDALERSADEIGKALGPEGSAWVLSDERTEEAAGREWKRLARGARLKSCVLPAAPKPVPTIELARTLAAAARQAVPGILVSIGSGVVSDLVKQVSFETGIPNWCVATAPSVDAYTSATAAIRVEGYHRAVPTAVSRLVACDLGTMRRAPRELVFAGLGDLLAKIIARLDWEVARLVTGEYYCPLISDCALSSARRALQAARSLATDPSGTSRALTDAVLTSGLAMQAIGGSRPGASAEHTIGHFWEMTDAVQNKRWELHGVLVGAASRLVLGVYRRFFEMLACTTPDPAPLVAAADREADWEDGLDPAMRPYLAKIREEMAKVSYGRSTLSARLERFQAKRRDILELGRALLDELDDAVRLLEGLGFPFSLREIGVSDESVMLSVRNVRLLRSRYSCFDLAHDLGVEGDLTAQIEKSWSG